MAAASLPGARAAAGAGSGWSGRLELGLEPRNGRTVLVRRRHEGPLMVQSPFYPEGPVCHVYVLHPPGGVVGGDRLELEVGLAPSGHALLTTPAATKLYRSAGPTSRVGQSLRVGKDACLEWLPQETIVFSGARVRLATRVHLEPGARFIGWEATCLGRPASDEPFADGEVRQDFEMWSGGEPRLIERNRLMPGAALMDAPWGLGGRRCLATLLAAPAEEHVLAAARRALDTVRGAVPDKVCAAATEVDGVLACRLLAPDSTSLRRTLVALWRAVRPALAGREAVEPRIWAT